MALSDVSCRNAQRRDRDYKLADSKGLFLLVKPSGSRLWRMKYRFAGKEKQLAFGAYPEVKLTAARAARDEARALIARGIDPSAEKQRQKTQREMDAIDTFERVAQAWHAQRKRTLTERYGEQILSRLKDHAFPKLGKRPIRDIKAPEVLQAIRAIEAKGAKEMAHRVRMHISDVFVWAIAAGLADNDPAAIIRKALMPTDSKLRPAVTKIEAARTVLRKTEAVAGERPTTLLASRLLALTAARPGVILLADRREFEDLDGKAPLWRIPANKMKLTRERKRDAAFEFVVPLSRQSVAVVNAALAASHSSTWLFPARFKDVPLANTMISELYRVAGFRGQHVPHGWRASFSTIMNERAAVEERETDRAIIDLMLAHVPEGVEAAYNRAAYMPRRRELAQAWADMLMDGLPAAETLLAA